MVSRRLQACFQQVSKHSVHLFWSFDCFASLRAHSRAGAPTGPSAASLRARAWAGAPTGPSAASLRARAWAGAPDWSLDCFAALRASCLPPLDCFACAARSRLGWRPDCSFSCSAALRASCLPRSTASLRFALTPGLAPRLVPRLLRFALAPRVFPARLLRCAPRLVSSRSTASLRCAPRVLPARLLRARLGWRPDWSFDCSAALRASCPPARPLRFAPRSRLGWRPRLILRLLRCAPRSRPGLAPPTAPSSAPLRFARAWLSTLACEISQAAGLCYAGVRSGARYVVHAPSIPDLSAKELASA